MSLRDLSRQLERLAGRRQQPSSTSSGSSGTQAAGVNATPTAVNTAALKTPADVATTYVNLWSSGNYSGMYQLLSTTSQQVINEKDFVDRYNGINTEVGETAVKATVNGNPPETLTRIPIHVVWQTGKVGEIQQDNVLTLVQDSGAWRVDWTPSMIFADLGDGFVRWIPDVPQRGRILDRKGRPLASLGTITKVGIVPGQIKDEASLLQQLSQILGMPQDQIKALYSERAAGLVYADSQLSRQHRPQPAQTVSRQFRVSCCRSGPIASIQPDPPPRRSPVT